MGVASRTLALSPAPAQALGTPGCRPAELPFPGFAVRMKQEVLSLVSTA